MRIRIPRVAHIPCFTTKKYALRWLSWATTDEALKSMVRPNETSAIVV
jgi:hypothetical protein